MLNSSVQANQDATQSNSQRPSLQARKQQLVRNAIWDAAIDLFAEKGFDETTVDDIVEAAGVSRRSFFRYFSSKSDLMTQRGTMGYEALVTAAIESCPPSYSVPEVLRQTVLQVARQLAGEPRTRQIMAIAAKYPSAREALSRVAQAQEAVAEAFARHSGKGSKGRMTASLLAALTLSMVGTTVHAWVENGQRDISITVDQVFATLDRLLCHSSEPGKEKRSQSAAGNHKPKRSPH